MPRFSKQTYKERTRRLAPRTGDILYSREGGRFGMAALVPVGVDLCLGQRMMLFRPRKTFDSRYFMWLMNSEPFYGRIKEETVGAASPRINIPTVMNVRVPCPPPQEQIQIANDLEIKTARIDALVRRLKHHIRVVAEYRQALISVAVTGKIDVITGRPHADP
jgi:type I restriction enzyme, S subunit